MSGKNKSDASTSTTPTNPFRVFRQAEIFLAASDLLSNFILPPGIVPGASDARMVIPRMMNRAFALELYLKCLILLDGGTIPMSHEYDVLFNRLSDLTKADLERRYEESIQSNSVALAIKSHFASAEFGLPQVLAAEARAFVRWRYVFEGVPPSFLSEWLLQAARERALDCNPDWQARMDSLAPRLPEQP